MSTNTDTQAVPAPWQPPAQLPVSRETERLVLRFWRPDDAPGMLAAIDTDRASFLPWLPFVNVDNRNLAECTYQIEKMRREREQASPLRDNFVIGIFDRATGAVVGGTGLHRINHGAHEGEIGYWIRPDLRSQGFCTEAVSGLISWAFADHAHGGWGLRRLHIRCAGRNAASQRVPRKLGLREEGRLVQDRFVEGLGWDDTLIWGVLSSEWDVPAGRLRE